MSEFMRVLLNGVEEFAKSVKEQTEAAEQQHNTQKELIARVERLTDRVDKLLELFEENMRGGTLPGMGGGKRMMDIKQRIKDVIDEHPEGIRPPKIARILGTKVQNLYPHLKAEVGQKIIIKDKSGTYFPAGEQKKSGGK